MNLTKFAIKRPLALLMVVLALFIFGIKSYNGMKTSLMPETNIPFVLVQTIYPGASAEVIESQVTAPLEKQLFSLPGIKNVTSYSLKNVSSVALEFNMDRDPDQAVADVNKRVNEFKTNLPEDAADPAIQKIDNNASSVIDYALYSDNKNTLERYVQDDLKSRIERIEGVGQVNIFGLSEKEVRVTLKSDAASRGITSTAISDALANKAFGAKLPSVVPLGSVKEGERDLSVEINSEITSLEEIKNLSIVSTANGSQRSLPVKIGEVADVELVDKESETYFRTNGKSAVGISVMKQSDASDVNVATEVKKLLGGEKSLPVTKMVAGVVGFHFEKEQYEPELDLAKEGITAKVTSDPSIYIKESVNGVLESLIEGVILTGLFLLLFLRSIRSTLIVLVSIPTALVITFIGMKAFGFTLNVLSLLGVAMSIGILVDDSIVVIENIFAKLKKISDPEEAAYTGRMEIGGAALAITMVDVVVYLPLALLTGMVGQFFKQFAAVVVVATLASLVIAFTLTPMLSAKLVSQKDEEGYRWLKWFDSFIQWLKVKYAAFLEKITQTGWRVAATIILVFAVLFGSIIISAPNLKQEFMASGDDGTGALSIELPIGTNVSATNNQTLKIEELLKNEIRVKDYYVTAGSGSQGNTASIRMYYGSKEDRSQSSKEITNDLQEKFKGILPGDAIVTASVASQGWGNKEVMYTLSGPDFNKLIALSSEFEKKAQEKDLFKDISLSLGRKTESLIVDMGEKSSSLGVNPVAVLSATSGKIKSNTSGKFIQGSEEIDIVVDDKSKITTEKELRSIALAPGLTLEGSTEIKRAESYPQIEHRDKERAISFGANLKPGADSGKAAKEINQIIADLKLEDGYEIKADSSTRMMEEGFAELGSAVLLSIGLIFMVMVALYESLLIPFVIMFTLPTAVGGSFLLLYILGAPMDITAMVGFIALMGLVAKNGILLVDFIERARKEGVEVRQAVIQSGKARLRPILMTTLAIVVASIPLVLGNVPGSEFRRGIAIVFIGGLTSSLLLTLVLVPAVYLAVNSARERFYNRRARKKGSKPKKVATESPALAID
ncbi:MAG TPA: efflux RND transporter permease subunit [bacterium]|nr:efflux RND transporter permease subunit [bacterium]